jgi:hypothetical protein
MKTLSLSSLALAAGVAALPFPEDVAPVKNSPVNMASAMEAIMAFADGKLANIMGGEKATEQFTNLARLMGAGPGAPGEMATIIRDVFNGKIPLPS